MSTYIKHNIGAGYFAYTTEDNLTEVKFEDITDLDTIIDFEDSPHAATKLENAERGWRDAQLKESDLIALQASLGELGRNLNAVKAYRQALRDWPAHANFPDPAYRPSM